MLVYHKIGEIASTSRQITPKACISSIRSIAYHQRLAVVYHQAAGICTLARDEMQGRFTALDDIHLASHGDDMPSLRLG